MAHTFLLGSIVKLKICYNLLNYNEKRPYHDISDRAWANIEKLLPGSKGSIGRPSADNRLLITAVFWILRTGGRGGFTPSSWRLEKYTSPLLPMARSGRLGENTRSSHCRT